jgi:hypothetical protein
MLLLCFCSALFFNPIPIPPTGTAAAREARKHEMQRQSSLAADSAAFDLPEETDGVEMQEVDVEVEGANAL